MHLFPPDGLDPDEIEGWLRHPVAKWFFSRLEAERESLFWDRLHPDNIHMLYRFQGSKTVLDGILKFAKGENK